MTEKTSNNSARDYLHSIGVIYTVVLLFVRLDVMSVFGLVIGYFFSVDQLGSFRAVVYENKSTGKRIESASLSPLSLSLFWVGIGVYPLR